VQVLAHPEARKPVRLPPVPERAPREALGGLFEALRLRASLREYAEEPLRLEELGLLAWAACGENGREERGFRYRTVPSAGALYPLELYAACRAVEGVAPGVYRYSPEGHSLEPRRTGDVSRELARAALGQGMLARAAAVFAISAVESRTTRRYGERGRRYVLMEVGAASENLHLAATALGLGSCAVGAFDDESVNAILGLDGRAERALLLQTVGRPAGSEGAR